MKMINLTVKTLDSRNHQFSVDGDMTVENFKRHIAETVDIPAETQRIIYCGRVLQDGSKLNEHDLDGKVVHLVQRAPPSVNTQGSRPSRTSSPHPQRRAFRGFDHANTMFLGSVAFPTNLMDSAPLHTPVHTNSRLHIIRRMLRRAERVICQLENPNRSGEQSPLEDSQEETTPVIEARVIVPNSSTEPVDEAAILSAVHNYTISSSQNRRGSSTASTSSTNSSNQSTTNNVGSSNSSDQQQQRGLSDPAIPEDPIRTARMAEVLTTLSQIQQRFTPFLERYHNFMRDDPVTSREEDQTVQTEMQRVSEVMHFLAHAYHALSDMYVRVMTPPPRPVLCRPIVIQHSAVLQAGIPIQVEAQINLSNERPSAASAPQTPSTGDVPASTPNTTAPTATPQSFPSQAVPLISTVRVPIPLDLRGMMAQGTGTASNTTTPIMIGNMMNAAAASQTASAPFDSSTTDAHADGIPTSTNATASGDGIPVASTSNPEVEFIMEVTPEGITIDSLETAIIDSSQADDLLRGALNGQQPPNLIQSIMQMAGQLITQRGGQTGTTVAAQFSSSSATSAPTLTPSAPSQNSQARGNNQTHPTSSTHTRSTARPHVHLQHHTMPGSFDPLLPCNSHHVTRRRNHQTATAQQQQPGAGAPRADQQQQTAPAQDAASQINSLMNSIMSGIRTSYQMRRPGASAQNERRSTQRTSIPGATPRDESSSTNSESVLESTASAQQTATNNQPLPFPLNDTFRNGPSLAEVLQQFPFGAPYVPGESIITDFIMLLSRNLTMGDVLSLNAGSVAPLVRLAGEIQNFFRSTLLNGSTTSEAVDSAVERLLNEIQPFLDTLAQIPIRDDVDIDASVRHLLRAKLPLVLQLASRLADEPTNIRNLVDHLISSVKEFCALLHACCEGGQGFEQIFEIIVTQYLQGIPSEIQEWTLLTSRSHLRQFFANLNVPHGVIEPHIVHKNPILGGEPMSQENVVSENESMETEEASSVTENDVTPSQSQRFDDISEPLPNVMIGSDPWHNQVPADWVPIIARDAQRQKKQHSQAPFSDAYLAGMPSKRRKIVHGTKNRQGPPMQQIIAESVKRAVTSTGLTSVAPLDAVAQAAGSSADIQAAYRGLLRSSVQPSLRNNEDFTPERFPHATSYFSEP